MKQAHDVTFEEYKALVFRAIMAPPALAQSARDCAALEAKVAELDAIEEANPGYAERLEAGE